MKFEKGNKLGKGRPKGSANKSSDKIRDAFALLLEENLEQIKQDFEELEPEKRVKLFLDMSKYIVPQLKATDITTNGESIEIPNINFTSGE
jgi:hypothetical protein